MQEDRSLIGAVQGGAEGPDSGPVRPSTSVSGARGMAALLRYSTL